MKPIWIYQLCQSLIYITCGYTWNPHRGTKLRLRYLLQMIIFIQSIPYIFTVGYICDLGGGAIGVVRLGSGGSGVRGQRSRATPETGKSYRWETRDYRWGQVEVKVCVWGGGGGGWTERPYIKETMHSALNLGCAIRAPVIPAMKWSCSHQSLLSAGGRLQLPLVAGIRGARSSIT